MYFNCPISWRLVSFVFEDIYTLDFQSPILVYGYAAMFQAEIDILWEVYLHMQLMGSFNVLSNLSKAPLLTDRSFSKDFKTYTV